MGLLNGEIVLQRTLASLNSAMRTGFFVLSHFVLFLSHGQHSVLSPLGDSS